MSLNRMYLLLLACFLGNITSKAQPKLWDIYTTSNQPFVNVVVDSYRSDSLYLKSMNQSIVLHRDSIRYIVRRNASQTGLGILAGAVAGGVLVGSISGESDGYFEDYARIMSVTLGIVTGGIVGGVIGAAMGADTRYDFDKVNSEKRRRLLTRLFPER